ncbi:hypothetical protein AWH69_04005 [Janibacter melonis]|uniref:Type II secretion system protein GspF domain-containing protein n=1 Tax=Janibacter melonis TaxID=262209 RepID=A0A176QGW8_9MICO|nr:type II secretion system F family protein [Janibacter melonis]MBD5830602.1 hypothetical protein [Janibacter melonis]OAB88940.1 hypothetical protein AWH69_04005 [Janibacter melonis]
MTPGDTPLMMLAGALVGLGLSLLLWRVRPAQVDLGSALDRLSPDRSLAREDRSRHATKDADAKDALGRWAMRTLPLDALGAVPTRELALLRIPVHRYFGEKVLFAIVGLVAPFAMLVLFAAVGFAVPIFFAIMGSLTLGSLLFFLPDYNVRDDAEKARKEFGRALASYIDLVALERNAGSGPRQAMEVAASIGDAWVFRRIGEELARSRWSGQPPWDALRALSDDLGLPELADLADIMRLSGEEGAQVYATLRARSQGMRTAELNTALAEANAIGERLSIPMSTLGLIFMAILVAPALLRIVAS